MRLLTVSLMMLVLSACSFTPQEVKVTMPPQYNAGTEGVGKALSVEVADARADKSVIGYWGKPDKKEAPITMPGDAVSAMQLHIAEGMAARGFSIGEASAKASNIHVELRSLAYRNSYEFWKIGTHVTGLMHVTAKNGKNEFAKDYLISREEFAMKAPSPEKNSRYVSQALTNAADALVNDPELLAFLGK